MIARLFARLRRALGLEPALPPLDRAALALEAALAEDDAETRLARLREALAQAERVSGPDADLLVLEASLALGERLRSVGRRDEAVTHFERAVMRSFRVGDPTGRHRRAGVLSRLAILDQEAGETARARQRYGEAIELGRDSESAHLLGMLTQAAFNLGILLSEEGDTPRAVERWHQALELGLKAGHPGGWDPAAVAAFNLGHHFVREGELARAQRMFEAVGRVGEPSGTPLGRMACAKAALALAGLSDREGLLGAPEADRQYRRAIETGRASGLPEGALAALQGALALAERATAAGRGPDAIVRLREALALAADCEPGAAFRFALLARLRLGQALGDAGERAEATVHLRQVFELGRTSDEPVLREIAGQAACNLHRAFALLERWDEARGLAEESLAFTRTLDTPTGRALEAAARYAQAFQMLHEGRPDDALGALDEVTRLGEGSGTDVGARIALDARLLAGHLHRRARRFEPAVRAFKDALARLRDRDGADPETDALAAMAMVNLGHTLLGLEREYEARFQYESALARGRASGTPSGRTAAANAALNLASLTEGEESDERRREWLEVARALGRSSGTTLGTECAAQAERALARLDGRDAD